jgi:predicted RNA methylase
LWSILAARNGASAVFAVEKDPRVADYAQRNIRAAGVGAIVRLIVDDVRSLRLGDVGGERVNMVIAENLSTWNVTEPQLSVMNHVNTHLAESAAVRIPERLFHHAELTCSRYRFADLVDLRTHYFGFTGIPKPTVFSRPTLFRVIDLQQLVDTELSGEMDLVATRTGAVNSLRLTSPLQVCGPIRFQSSDSLMPPVIVPLPEDLTVVQGDVVRVRVAYRCESDWTQFVCSARVVPHGAPAEDVDLLVGEISVDGSVAEAPLP